MCCQIPATLYSILVLRGKFEQTSFFPICDLQQRINVIPYCNYDSTLLSYKG